MVPGVISGDASTDVKLQSMAMIPTCFAILFLTWIWGLEISSLQLFNSLSKFEQYVIKVVWNSVRCKIEFVKEKKRKNVAHVQRVVFTLYVLGMVRVVLSEDTSTDHKLQSMAIIPVFVTTLFLAWIWSRHISQLQLFNSLSKFEDHLISKYDQAIFWNRLASTRISTQGMVIFSKIMCITLFAAPFLNFGMVLVNPCQPPFLGSMTPFCTGEVWSPSLIATIFRVIIPLIDLWCCFLCSFGGGAFIIIFFGVCVTSFIEYLDVIGRHLSQAPKLMSSIKLYRKICIVERMLNNAFSAVVVPCLLLNAMGVQICSGFVTISRHSLIPMPQFLLYPLVWLNAIVFNFLVTTLSSYVYGNSGKIVGKLEKIMCHLRFRYGRRIAQRELRSCSRLKIKLGNNFIDGMTPLVNQDLAWNQTMSLMLLRKP
ncbi:hypothetical protein Fcan01_16030 [Folsomia candida]|uniref:Uncharacterized protein n=1 Tax=Folsomia candida TaxID=158441 RepID=A0A226DVN0_FOLCA|nr:hypothetical protein Fcan01_16030 [Folsomia candida]